MHIVRRPSGQTLTGWQHWKLWGRLWGERCPRRDTPPQTPQNRIMALLIGHPGVVGKKNLFFIRFFSLIAVPDRAGNAKNLF